MDATITLSVSDLSPGMARSALSLAVGILSGSLSVEPGPDLDSVINDLRSLRNKIVEAQNGN